MRRAMELEKLPSGLNCIRDIHSRLSDEGIHL